MSTNDMSRRLPNPDDSEMTGLVDVKFPKKRKGRRAWCRCWVVIVKVRVESGASPKSFAKVDIFQDEDSWKKGKHAERIILEKVTNIRRTPSSSHKYAFFVDGETPMALAGRNETETQDWMSALRAIFMPKMERRIANDEDIFEVSVIDNLASREIDLNADYLMSIQSTHILLIPTTEHQKCCQLELSMIRFFSLASVDDTFDKDKVLQITSSQFLDNGETVYLFYSLRARELINLIWSSIKVIMDKRDSNGDIIPITMRSRASTDSTAGSELNSHSGTPTRQSAASGIQPEELKKRINDHKSWSHGYDTLQRQFVKRQTSEGVADIKGWKATIAANQKVEEENIYNHIGSEPEDCSTDEEDDYDYPNSVPVPLINAQTTLAHNPIFDCPKVDSPPIPPPSPRLRLNKPKGRTTSDSSNASKTSSRDSGILSPTEIGPNILEEPRDRQGWRHNDSVDSAYSSSTRRGSSEPSFLADNEELAGDSADTDLLKQSISAEDLSPEAVHMASPFLDMVRSNSLPGEDEENLYEELSKKRCSYRKNLMSFLGADIDNCRLLDSKAKELSSSRKNSLESSVGRKNSIGSVGSGRKGSISSVGSGRKGSIGSAVSRKDSKVLLTKELKMAEIRNVLMAMGKSDDEDNIYEDLDTFMKKKKLSNFFGEEFSQERDGAAPPEPPIRPQSIVLQRTRSQFEGDKRRRFGKLKNIVKMLKSPRAGKAGDFSGLGSDSSLEDDPQREANRTLKTLESLQRSGRGVPSVTPDNVDNLDEENKPPLPKPRTVSASAAVVGSPRITRERKRSKSHPNDFYKSGADATPAFVPDASADPDYDVPMNNASVVNPSDVIQTVRPPSQLDVNDLISGDNDYEDLTEPLSPFIPFSNEPFNLAYTHSNSRDQVASLASLSSDNRIQSEPDFRKRYPDSGGREATSLPSGTSPRFTLPRTPSEETNENASYDDRSSSFELSMADIARPISVFDGNATAWSESPLFHVSSEEDDFYSFDNSEYISLTQNTDRSSILSDIPESERSRGSSFSTTQQLTPNRRISGTRSPVIDSIGTDNGLGNRVFSDDTSDYLDMSGQIFKAQRSESKSSYVSMTGPFLEKESDC